MKYIDLINSFWDLATTNPLSTGQVSLYFALLHVCNRSYWTEWFQAPNQVLSVLTGLSRSGIQKARNELKQRGLIDFRERGTKATIYRLVMAGSFQTDVFMTESNQAGGQNSGQKGNQNSGQKGVQISNQDSAQTDVFMTESNQAGGQNGGQAISNNINNNINNKDKRQKTDTKPSVSAGHFDDFWSAYPNKQRRALAEKAYCDLILSGSTTEAELAESAQNYAEYVRLTGEKMYLPNNYLEKCIFDDFLPENYRKPSGHTDKKNGFHNFEQRKYDYDELERQLLTTDPER